jgi:hypothetical protein
VESNPAWERWRSLLNFWLSDRSEVRFLYFPPFFDINRESDSFDNMRLQFTWTKGYHYCFVRPTTVQECKQRLAECDEKIQLLYAEITLLQDVERELSSGIQYIIG